MSFRQNPPIASKLASDRVYLFAGRLIAAKHGALSASPAVRSSWSIAHLQKSRSSWNSLFRFSEWLSFFPVRVCKSVSLRSLQTKYFPVRITYVRFHSLPAILNTSCAVARRLQQGQLSTSAVFLACAFFIVTEISSVCELTTKPKNSKVVFQFELFFGARMPRPALPAQKVVRNPMRARPTRLKLICPRPIAGLL